MAVDWGRRVLTVLMGVPTALWLLSSSVGMLLLTTTVCCLTLVEYTNTISPQIVAQPMAANLKQPHRVLLISTGAVLCVGAWSGDKLLYDTLSFGATLAIITIHIATTTKMNQTAMLQLLLDLFALIYIVNGFSHAILLRYSSKKYGYGLQILGLCCAWVCDTGALIAGTFMGHVKLAPLVSPGKTLLGAIAGVVSSVAMALAIFFLSSHYSAVLPWTYDILPPAHVAPLIHQVMLGTVLGILCIVGDLVESFVKRVAGVKDSGVFFPGHGGLLDRMDSFLFIAPYLYFHSQYFVPAL